VEAQIGRLLNAYRFVVRKIQDLQKMLREHFESAHTGLKPLPRLSIERGSGSTLGPRSAGFLMLFWRPC
jgi:hypothetical protein